MAAHRVRRFDRRGDPSVHHLNIGTMRLCSISEQSQAHSWFSRLPGILHVLRVWLGNLDFQRTLKKPRKRGNLLIPLTLTANVCSEKVRKMGHDNLHRRGAVYYVIVTVPTDLQAAFGGTKPRKQIWASLRTKDRAEAKRRKSAVIDQWTATFDEMRRRRDLTDEDIAVAVWDHYAAGVEAGREVGNCFVLEVTPSGRLSGKVEDFQIVELLGEAGVWPDYCRENEAANDAEGLPVEAVA